MQKNFLVGNFLPAYGSGFGKIKQKNSAAGPGFTKEQLERSFERRTADRRSRRTQYAIALQAGFVVSLSAVTLVMNMDIRVSDVKTVELHKQELVAMEEIIQTKYPERPPPPARPLVPVAVPDDLTLEDEVLDFDAMLDLDDALAISAAPLPPPPEKAEELPEPEIFLAVESMPEMIGGMQALLKDLKYPEIALRAGLSGRVVIQIVVGEDGKPRNPVVVKSIQESLDNEAIRAVMLQTFIPGKQRGRAVPVYMNIPVTYRLQ